MYTAYDACTCRDEAAVAGEGVPDVLWDVLQLRDLASQVCFVLVEMTKSLGSSGPVGVSLVSFF